MYSRENWETPEAKGGGKDGRDDAADARLIARHDGQHPCSLFPPYKGETGGIRVPSAGCAPTRASVIRSVSQRRWSSLPSAVNLRPLSSLRLSTTRQPEIPLL